MLVDGVHVVKHPNERVSGRVGFYFVKNSLKHRGIDLLLSEKSFYAGHNIFARIANWKAGLLRRASTTGDYYLIKHMVEGVAEIMQSVSKTRRNVILGE